MVRKTAGTRGTSFGYRIKDRDLDKRMTWTVSIW